MRKLKFAADLRNEYLDMPGSYSFLNFASIDSYLAEPEFDRISYFADGMLMAAFVSIFTGQKVKRVSFDYTSIAEIVFSNAERKSQLVYIIGASDEQLNRFKQKLIDRYPKLPLAGVHSGYLKIPLAEIATEIVASGARVVVVGMGAGLQEKLLLKLVESGFNGTAYTCGGFIRQESSSINQYYPYWIDKANLRWAYRMYREPHTIKRYIFSYPVNAFKMVCLLLRGKLRLLKQIN